MVSGPIWVVAAAVAMEIGIINNGGTDLEAKHAAITKSSCLQEQATR